MTRRPDRPAFSAALVAVALAGAFAAAHAVVSGTPVLDGGLDLLSLAGGAAGAMVCGVLAARLWPHAATFARRAAVLAVTLVVVSVVFGVANQVVIDGKVYWRGSTEARAYDTSVDLRGDLYLLQENQALLNLSPDQGRGLADAYRQAYAQALAVAARWNPATAPQAPLDGLADAYVLANRSAAAQAQALSLYLDNLEVFDEQRAAEVARLAALAADSYSQAATVLASTLQEAGIRLPGRGDE